MLMLLDNGWFNVDRNYPHIRRSWENDGFWNCELLVCVNVMTFPVEANCSSIASVSMTYPYIIPILLWLLCYFNSLISIICAVLYRCWLFTMRQYSLHDSYNKLLTSSQSIFWRSLTRLFLSSLSRVSSSKSIKFYVSGLNYPVSNFIYD